MTEQLQQQGIAFAEGVPMSSKTTFRIGGPAELMLYPNSVEQLQACIKLCHEAGEKPFLLGRGSNLLVKDSGLDGVVISTEKMVGMEDLGDGKMYVEAGVNLAVMCNFALKHNLTGAEFAFGIPGALGGSTYMNAGAYDGEMSDIIAEVLEISSTGELNWLPVVECAFGYRKSVFMQTGGVVAAARLQLKVGDPAKIKAEMDDIMHRRRDKQPLEFPNAGSAFKRPPGHFAGGLIQQCDLKGRSVGGAQISEKHAGFIINTGGATAADVRALIALVQEVVQQETGVFLEPEIKFV
ncbi:MAG: UDP-N-acetylmuramate dehydrogenase [Oscillospiraceae bacterium]|nr:UDP-N-acetylmuramate dehydrogenase [Oscillospiraceae bacterium]